MNRKAFFLLLAVLLSAGALAFGQDTNTAAANVAPLGDTAAFAKFSAPVTVHVGMEVDPTDKTLLPGDTPGNNYYTRYLMDKYNIKIAVDWTAATGDNNRQKISLAIASGNLPDAMVVPDQTYMLKAAQSGLLYNLSTLFKQYASKQVQDIMASTNGSALTMVSYQDKMVALPNTTTTADGVIEMWIRHDWLDKLGLAVPKTVADVENVAKAFMAHKMAGDATIGIAGPAKDTNMYCDFLSSSNLRAGFRSGLRGI